ncbi:3005_t:CDS:2 [Diversispora eburnea]|uniref:3005_t:CDS:1 n=1 Tax=Diversispora eburnea TaxID=1213867 RepID=A0A9N8VL53_9GLOM|nr:3005_t:CDS:2 [Diversispora eburnea]
MDKANVHRTFYKALETMGNDQKISQEFHNVIQELLKGKKGCGPLHLVTLGFFERSTNFGGRVYAPPSGTSEQSNEVSDICNKSMDVNKSVRGKRKNIDSTNTRVTKKGKKVSAFTEKSDITLMEFEETLITFFKSRST